MMIKHPGDTVSRNFTFTDQNGNLFDPTGITCAIVDPTGTTQGTPSLDRVSTGLWSLDWNLPSTAIPGIWKIEVTATSGPYEQAGEFTFRVVPL